MAEALGGKLLENARRRSLSNGGTPRLGLEFRELESGVGDRDPLNARSKQQPHEDGALLAMRPLKTRLPHVLAGAAGWVG